MQLIIIYMIDDDDVDDDSFLFLRQLTDIFLFGS